MSTITILLLEGEALIREGILAVLGREPDLEVVCATGSLEQALQGPVKPDVIVVEPLTFGDKSQGAESVADLFGYFPGAKVVVLTHLDSLGEVAQFLSTGVHGYVLKSGLATELVDGVRRVAGGDEYLQPSLGTALLKSASNGDGQSGGRFGDLSPKEEEVLRVLAMGHTNVEAAELLSYAVRTIEGYRARIMRKLGVHSRADLVRAAAEMHLSPFDPHR